MISPFIVIYLNKGAYLLRYNILDKNLVIEFHNINIRIIYIMLNQIYYLITISKHTSIINKVN